MFKKEALFPFFLVDIRYNKLDNLITKFTELFSVPTKIASFRSTEMLRSQCPDTGHCLHVLCGLWRALVGHDVAVPFFLCLQYRR